MKQTIEEGITPATLETMMHNWMPMGEAGMNMWRTMFDQISRAEAFRELLINRLQQCQGFIAATLALPKAHKIACRAQLPGKGLLAPCSFQALDEQVLNVVGCRAPGRLQQIGLDSQ